MKKEEGKKPKNKVQKDVPKKKVAAKKQIGHADSPTSGASDAI